MKDYFIPVFYCFDKYILIYDLGLSFYCHHQTLIFPVLKYINEIKGIHVTLKDNTKTQEVVVSILG